MVKDQVVNTGRRKLGAVLGDNVKTGIKSLFMPGVKVGANTWVGANFMVERDLPANTTATLKQDSEIKQKNRLMIQGVLRLSSFFFSVPSVIYK